MCGENASPEIHFVSSRSYLENLAPTKSITLSLSKVNAWP
jgi:hypothetical protein